MPTQAPPPLASGPSLWYIKGVMHSKKGFSGEGSETAVVAGTAVRRREVTYDNRELVQLATTGEP